MSLNVKNSLGAFHATLIVPFFFTNISIVGCTYLLLDDVFLVVIYLKDKVI